MSSMSSISLIFSLLLCLLFSSRIDAFLSSSSSSSLFRSSPFSSPFSYPFSLSSSSSLSFSSLYQRNEEEGEDRASSLVTFASPQSSHTTEKIRNSTEKKEGKEIEKEVDIVMKVNENNTGGGGKKNKYKNMNSDNKKKGTKKPEKKKENEEESIGVAKALATPESSKAAEFRAKLAQNKANLGSSAKWASRKDNNNKNNNNRNNNNNNKRSNISFNPFTLSIEAGRAARRALESLAGEDPQPMELLANKPENFQTYFDNKFLFAVPKPSEDTPTILVVGATGLTGRQVVRKLLLRGYNVNVLVRNLYSSTLNILGTGVSYAKGSLSDVESLTDACKGVDKVVFVAQSRNATNTGVTRNVEYIGLKNLASAMVKTRLTEDQKKAIMKKTIFKFRKEVDTQEWFTTKVSSENSQAAEWTVDPKSSRPTFRGQIRDNQSLILQTKKVNVNLQNYDGFIMLYQGYGSYKFVVRTSAYEKYGIQYEAELPTNDNRWITRRINFRELSPRKVKKDEEEKENVSTDIGTLFDNKNADKSFNEMNPEDIPLDSSDITQFLIVAQSGDKTYSSKNNGSRVEKESTGNTEGETAAVGPTMKSRPNLATANDGPFSLTLEGMKVVVKRKSTPDIVILSPSDVTSDFALSSPEQAASQMIDKQNYFRALGESALKNSGLSYSIVRVSGFKSNPQEGKALSITKARSRGGLQKVSKAMVPVSHTDAAEVLVTCLTKEKIINTEIYASEDPRYGETNIGKLIDDLYEQQNVV